MSRKQILKRPRAVPSSAGIYIFRRGKKPLYIGKAADLKKRLSSYWRKNQASKTEALLREATNVEWIELPSEIDALIKEAEFIKKYRPKYNVLMRDDKSYFYAAVTREEFPRIFVSHEPRGEARGEIKARYIGPFTSGTALRDTLKFLRRAFPYCTCKKPHKRPCLNAQIGRCSGYCCDISEKRKAKSEKHNEYFANIKNIKAILKGRRKSILQELNAKMKTASRVQDFEKAAVLRDQIANLENVFLHQRVFEGPTWSRSVFSWPKISQSLQKILGSQKSISRVEGYDIANISGTLATGSMVVAVDGIPAKSEYRKFKIKTVQGPDDFSMIKEVLARRLRHPEWPYPDLILIDGGKGQLNAARAAFAELRRQHADQRRRLLRKSALSQRESAIMVIALAKREEELFLPGRKNSIPLRALPQSIAFFFQRLRNESHRFARAYHHKLREIKYRDEKTKKA